jgi:hypothetical protein
MRRQEIYMKYNNDRYQLLSIKPEFRKYFNWSLYSPISSWVFKENPVLVLKGVCRRRDFSSFVEFKRNKKVDI